MRKHVLCLLVVGLGAASIVSRAQVPASCIDNAVINCYNGCNDPLSFKDCIIGCAIGSNNDPRNCREKCSEPPVCESNCIKSSVAISNCSFVAGQLTATCGVTVLNRATGFWSRTVRVTNTSQEPIGDIAFVVDSLAAGWSLLNGDGVTEDYAPAGMPYKNVPTLAAGQSSTFTLQFKRTGTLPFGYVTRVITASGKG